MQQELHAISCLKLSPWHTTRARTRRRRASRFIAYCLRARRCDQMELFTPGQLALRTQGALLTDDSVLLSATGVSFCSRGSQLQDIFLYVPHLIS